MQITGTFKDKNNKKTYAVTISKAGDAQSIYNIQNVTDPNFNDTTPTILFSMDPVHITTDYSDTFAHNIVKSASVNLITNFNLRDLVLANNNNDVNMVITCGNTVIFDGYVEPLCFSEPYARFWNEIEITANDKLASAQYVKYPQVVLERLNEMMSFLDATEGGIIDAIAEEIGLTVDTSGLNNGDTASEHSTEILQAMQTTKISNTIFAGESPDDWMTCFDVLESVGRYWGIWFMQVGNTLRLLDWHNETRTAISSGGTLSKKDFIDDSTSISTADAYTQIKLSCDIEGSDSIVEFGDDLTSPYKHYVKYMEELVAEGNGSTAAGLFKELILSDETGENTKQPTESYKYKNFCWVKESNLWDFGPNGYTSLIDSGMTQQGILHWLWQNPGKGAFVAFGRTDKQSAKDNSPINSLELQDSLIISICGHDTPDYDHDMQALFAANSPICSFTGSSKQFTPVDSDTTNYLIISGKVFLNKMYGKTGEVMHYNYDRSGKSGFDYDQCYGTLYADYCNDYEALYELVSAPKNKYGVSKWDRVSYHNGVPRIGSNDYGCFYTQRFYDGPSGGETESTNKCLVGDLKQNKYQQTWKYEYSWIEGQGKKIDNTSKIPILVCELKIGDKYCVERIDKANGAGWGEFEWMTEEEINELPQINGESWKYLTIGFNPKLDDYILGTNYDIQNTIWYYDDVDGTGTAIPIKYSDNLAGEVKFTIKQPTFSYWGADPDLKGIIAYILWRQGIIGQYPILEKLESIILSDFKIELTSNKGHILNNTEANDLVYVSDENDNYVDSYEDDTKIATMITSAEAAAWGTELVISDSHVSNTDNTPFFGFGYDSGEVDGEGNAIINYIKPEQLYVNNYYLEYSTARQIVETGIKLKDIDWLQTPDKYMFKFGFLEGDYVPIGYDANLLNDSVAFTMKDMTKNTNDNNGE